MGNRFEQWKLKNTFLNGITEELTKITYEEFRIAVNDRGMALFEFANKITNNEHFPKSVPDAFAKVGFETDYALDCCMEGIIGEAAKGNQHALLIIYRLLIAVGFDIGFKAGMEVAAKPKPPKRKE